MSSRRKFRATQAVLFSGYFWIPFIPDREIFTRDFPIWTDCRPRDRCLEPADAGRGALGLVALALVVTLAAVAVLLGAHIARRN